MTPTLICDLGIVCTEVNSGRAGRRVVVGKVVGFGSGKPDTILRNIWFGITRC